MNEIIFDLQIQQLWLKGSYDSIDNVRGTIKEGFLFIEGKNGQTDAYPEGSIRSIKGVEVIA